MSTSEGSPDLDSCQQETPEVKKYPDYCRTITFTDNNGVVRELVFPKALDLDRPKRARTTFSRDQLDRLEAEFAGNQYLVGRERSQLARTLGLSETQVKVWFQNRRTKHKRDKEKQEEHREAKAESMATKSLLSILQPSTKSPTALTHSDTTPNTSFSLMSDTALSLPVPEAAGSRCLDPDTHPTSLSSTPPRHFLQDVASLRAENSGTLPVPAALTHLTGSPHRHFEDHTASLSARTALTPMSRFGMSPLLHHHHHHHHHRNSLPIGSLSSISLQPVALPSCAGLSGLPAPMRGCGSGAQCGSFGISMAVHDAWVPDPYAVVGCQAPFGPTAMPAVAARFPAAWPVYSHSLTR